MCNKVNVIQIEITGPVGSGKTALLHSIREMLEQDNYCVAIPNRQERRDGSGTIANAPSHGVPKRDHTVIVITESIEKS
jgi:Ni2+-binding GTPase involved in maturation of urease and hydrogenase